MVVAPEGPPCSCENRGCLEGMASGCAIRREAQALVRSGRGERMLALAGGVVERVDARVVGEAAREGDLAAQEILAAAGRCLGIAIASVTNLLNPAAFIIGGGVACGVGELLLGPAREEAYRYSYPPYRDFLKIIPAALGAETGVLGAAAFALDKLGF